METTVCSIDRTVRVVLGTVLAVAGIASLAGVAAFGTFGVVALAVGLVLLGTGVVQLCPLYSLLGIDTCG
ncbi:YgaP family membrane protein [Natronobacterium gregoryi]|uniref:DUF2892 domain-containing protein n=1 Tax=Natronobacterium gregoryi (strain ATCC 43098 / DSM 3393 / CCM 3738 / CIP 104747 / IAM 13177 / JCM 8860 / NBRC 102187 / NCIMB 2189 / SP2) TaxID=797304 RepID=A0A2J4JJD2_NATGS|nr:DUF2892 domain-containing protein [Natronobacterium gregoryi SP2]